LHQDKLSINAVCHHVITSLNDILNTFLSFQRCR